MDMILVKSPGWGFGWRKNNQVMIVEINIPQFIINLCNECGYNEEQTKKLFAGYIQQISNDGYGQFNTNFEDWLQDDGSSGVDEILGN